MNAVDFNTTRIENYVWLALELFLPKQSIWQASIVLWDLAMGLTCQINEKAPDMGQSVQVETAQFKKKL
ncbi:hypothetical protein HI914_00270 [Erysiphe necator]|nr:hypothetical protein HI914_00270 [Erysiphe necator]